MSAPITPSVFNFCLHCLIFFPTEFFTHLRHNCIIAVWSASLFLFSITKCISSIALWLLKKFIRKTLRNMVYKTWVGKLRWKYTISHIWMLMETNCSLVMTYTLLKCVVSESLIWSNISWLFLMLTLYWTLWTFVYLMDI